MNVFYLDNDTQVSARNLVDKHIVKMPLETIQLLSTAHRLLDGELVHVEHKGKLKKHWRLPDDKRENLLYRATHINHPSAIWCRMNRANYRWLVSYLSEMCHEYHARYGRHFKFYENGMVAELSRCPNNLPDGEFTQLIPAMPERYKVGDSLESYRRYYAGDKWKFAKWKHGSIPQWFPTYMGKVWGDEGYTERLETTYKVGLKKTPPLDKRILFLARTLTCEYSELVQASV